MKLRRRRAIAAGSALLVASAMAACSSAPAPQPAAAAPASSAANDAAVPAGTQPSATTSSGPVAPSGSAGTSGSADPGYASAQLEATDAISAKGLPTVHFKIKTSKPIFFITVDDGYTKQKAALDYIRARKLPVTTFLTNAAVDGNYAYFKAFSAYDAVQNHTMTHKALSKDSTDRRFEICRAQAIYKAKLGVQPWILRPPYGGGMYANNSATQRNRILQTAASCGIKHIAMWNVTVSASGQVEYASSGKRLRPGDIVLLHFEGNVAANLKKVVALGRAQGLTPASLSRVLAR